MSPCCMAPVDQCQCFEGSFNYGVSEEGLVHHKHFGTLGANLYVCFDSAVKMGRDSGREAGKPRGKMSSYAYFVQTCREEHKKKHPDASVNFSEFSRKCSERWKVGDGSLSAEE